MFEKLETLVWSEPAGPDGSNGMLAPWRRRLLAGTRVLWMAAEGFLADACALRASALTLASMLALVPVLAASFAYVRGLGWSGRRLETLLLERATVLSPDAVSTVVSWVDHISITGLGLMGALFAIASSVSLLYQIEDAFDAIWGSREGRSNVRRAADAFVLLLLAPMLVAVAASSETALRSSSALTWLASFGGFELILRTGFALVWYVLVCGAFSALYYLLPSTPVSRRAAVVGGVVTGITWQFAQGLYVDFQIGLGGYNAVYGALAQLPALVLWMWTSWMLVLGGAEIAAAVQSFAVCGRRYTTAMAGAASRERLALSIAIELADAAYARREAPTLTELAALLSMPVRSVAEVFGALDHAGLVHIGGDEQRQCFLSLSPGSVGVDRVVAAARGEEDSRMAGERPAVAQVLARFEAARRAALGGDTLADLVDPRVTDPV